MLEPKFGDWIYYENKTSPENNGLYEVFAHYDGLRQLGINNHKGCRMATYISLCRPAVLDDFAVEIEGMGKVWFVKHTKTLEVYDTSREPWTGWNDDDLIQSLAGNAFAKSLNATIMPYHLYKKLSEGK